MVYYYDLTAISINYKEDFLMKKIIEKALKFCSKNKVRLTEPRLEVLKKCCSMSLVLVKR